MTQRATAACTFDPSWRFARRRPLVRPIPVWITLLSPLGSRLPLTTANATAVSLDDGYIDVE